MADADSYDSALLDLALNLSLDFGPNWRRSIADRLRSRYPNMRMRAIEEVDQLVREKRDWAHTMIESHRRTGAPDETEVRRALQAELGWASPTTIERLWSQGDYFAHK